MREPNQDPIHSQRKSKKGDELQNSYIGILGIRTKIQENRAAQSAKAESSSWIKQLLEGGWGLWDEQEEEGVDERLRGLVKAQLEEVHKIINLNILI